MKILLVAEVSIAQVIGGAERVLREQALGLTARGHTVRVLTRLAEGEKEEQVAVGGISETRYPVDRRTAVSFFISSVRNARRAGVSLARESRPDVLLIHQALPGLAAAGCLSGVPAVYMCLSLAHEEFDTRNQLPSGIGGQMWHRCQSLARRRIERAAMNRARRVIVLSDFMRRRIAECHRVEAERMLLIPAGVDTSIFSPLPDYRSSRPALGLKRDQFVLFTVRNLVPRMGLAVLLRAMVRLRQTIPHVQLLIGGSGPLRSELEAQVKTLDLEGCVRFLGFIPEDVLPEYYRTADVFVLPTAQLEGFGLVTIEALACGTPVFGTRIGATAEILRKVDYCLLSSGTDPESLASGIRDLYRWFAAEPQARVRLAEAGRNLVLRDYTWARHCEHLEAVLSEVLSHRTGSCL